MSNLKAFILLCISMVAFPFVGASQDTLDAKQLKEKEYEKRIQKEYLYRVYIPEDLADAFIQLNELIDAESKQKFLEVDEATAAKKLHFSLGRWIMHNWGFYEGSRLSHYMRNLGIFYPDDMARFIIITYHRNLRKNPLEVKQLIASFVKKREEEHLERMKEGEVLHEEKRKRKEEE